MQNNHEHDSVLQLHNNVFQFYTCATSLIMSQKMSIPFKKIFSFKNSLWSCNKIGVLGIGENPKAGIPTSRINLLSVPAGKISVATFNPFLSIAALNALNHGSSWEIGVIVWSVNFCLNSSSIPPPA